MPPPGNERIMAALIEKLADLITSPDTVNAEVRDASDSTFVAFAAAGVPVDAAALDFGDLSTQEQLRKSGRFSEVVNSIPDVAGFHRPSGAKVWDLYERALVPLDPSTRELSNREAVLLAKAHGFLSFEVPAIDSETGNTATTLAPTPQYETYNDRLTAYRASVLKYNAAAAARASSRDRAAAARDVAKAYQDWGSAGYRDYVDHANEIMSTMVAKAPPSVYDVLRHAFDLSLRHVPGTARTYYPTYVYPRNVLDRGYDDYWTRFAFAEDDLHCDAQPAVRKNRRAIPERYAAVTATGAANDGCGATTHEIDSRGMSIGFEILLVPLVRPWFVRGILEQASSSGVAEPCGSMPALPAAIVLARNLELRVAASKRNESLLETIADCARASYGPFALAADASSSLRSSPHAPNVTSGGLTVNGAQIVAVVCEVIPTSPGPARVPARPALLTCGHRSHAR